MFVLGMGGGVRGIFFLLTQLALEACATYCALKRLRKTYRRWVPEWVVTSQAAIWIFFSGFSFGVTVASI